MNSIKYGCVHSVVDDCAEGVIDCLAHAAGRHSKPQLDNIPSYAVAWAGGVSGSVVAWVVAAWRLLRARATTWLKRRESSSTVGVAVPFCQAVNVAGLTPTSWARRLAGVFESSMAPFMSMFKSVLFLFKSAFCEMFDFCFTSQSSPEPFSKKPIDRNLSRKEAPYSRFPLKYIDKCCWLMPRASARFFRLPNLFFAKSRNCSEKISLLFDFSLDIG